MDDLEKGTWIVNSTKHLQGVVETSPERARLEATELSGKAGMLLGRLVAGSTEEVPGGKVLAFARESGISRFELPEYLTRLKAAGKVDFVLDKNGGIKGVEVYCFSVSDAVRTVATVFDTVNPSAYDEANLASLVETFRLPRSEEELLDRLGKKGFNDSVARTTPQLQTALGLVKVTDDAAPEDKIYYNEYAFADDPKKIAKAIGSLDSADRDAVEEIQAVVGNKPGFLLESLERKYPRNVLRTMEGVGLLDAITVESAIGAASFATLPQQRGITIDTPLLSADVFHKAKVLLASLRFGEVKSMGWRGKIQTTEKMFNIVNKLLRGDWVGPCTAIGQDYQLLERDGVVETQPAGGGMYYMRLRQREVGLLVNQMLQLGTVVADADQELQTMLLNQPRSYRSPEQRRTDLLAKTSRPVEDLRNQLLVSIRTGAKG